jgi:hypothetical protein
MNRKWIPHIIAIAAFVVFIVLGLACASTPPYDGPDAQVNYKEVVVGYEKYIEENPNSYHAGTGFKIIFQSSMPPWIIPIGSGFVYSGTIPFGITVGEDQYIKFDHVIVSKQYPLYELRCENSPEKLVFYISVHPLDLSNPNGNKFWRLDRIEGMLSLEEAQAIVARQEAAGTAKVAAEAEKVAQEEAKRQAEQERLANLYRQAGNNFGNLRNTSRRYGTTFGNDYLTTIYNFGDGNYIAQTQSVLGLSLNPKTGTYRVNGDTVIFLSSEGRYSYGTIVGTALNIDGDIYR